MILVLLGTQDKEFKRLLEIVEKAIKEKHIKEKVVAQIGNTKYESNKIELFDFIPSDDFNNYLNQANIIITHGGAGSIINSLKLNKKVIGCPRLKKYKEHANNHQQQIIDNFTNDGYILSCNSYDELIMCLLKIKQFKPKKFKSNNKKMIKIITNYIDNN